MLLGKEVGNPLGWIEGVVDGRLVGDAVGREDKVGGEEGLKLTCCDGCSLGPCDGKIVGAPVGLVVG